MPTHASHRKVTASHLASLILVALGLLHSPFPARGAQMATRGSLTPQTSPAAQRELTTLRDALSRGEWEQALRAADRIVDEFPDELFELQDGWVVSGRIVRTAMIQQFDLPALQAYQDLVQPQAEALWNGGAETAAAQWLPLLDRFPHTPPAQAAAIRLGDRAWHQGDLSAARRYWRRAIPLHPERVLADAPNASAAPLVRLAACDVLEGRIESANKWLNLLRQSEPDASGRLGGVSGRYVELLEQLLAEAPHPPRGVAPELPYQRWRGEIHRATSTQGPPELCSLEVGVHAWGNVLTIADDRGIRALDLHTGTPAWPTGSQDDQGWIYEPSFGTSTSAVADSVPANSHAGVVSDGVWFGAVNLETSANDAPAGFDRLVALDLNAEGLIRWIAEKDTIAPSQPQERPLSWRFTGTVAAAGNLILATVRAEGAAGGLGVVSLDRYTGKMVSLQVLSAPLLLQELDGRDQLLIADEQLLLQLNGSVLISLDRNHLRVNWMARLPGRARGQPLSSNLPGVIAETGRLVAIGNEAVNALDPQTGRLIWTSPTLSPLGGIVGVQDAGVIIAGRHLWSVDVWDGQVIWRAGFDDEEAGGTGAAALVGASVLWGTDEELWIVGTRSGAILQRLPLMQFGLERICLLTAASDSVILGDSQTLSVLEIVSPGSAAQ